MQDFLSNIDIGVFDLDDVLKHGIGSAIPDRFKNQAKQAQKEAERLQKEKRRLQSLQGKVNKATEEVLQKRLKELSGLKGKIVSSKSNSEQLRAERELRGKTLGGKLQNFTTSTGGRIALGLGGLAIRSIQKTFSNIQETVDETGFFSSKLLEDFDSIGKRSREILINNERLYNSVDRNFETFIKFRREFGNTEEISVKLLDNISQMENIIGLSNEESIALLKTFRGINRESAQTNTQLIQSASMLASANNVAFRDVMQDVTDNAEFFATYMSQSSDKVAEMVIRSRRLGLEFSTFNSIFESFSGIEGTLETQARTSIFAGRRMDFLGVLEKLQGNDVQGAMSSIMNQIGGIGQGQFDNPFVKKQLAEGFGVDTETLNRLYREATGNMSVDDELRKEMMEFNKNFKQLGFGTLKKEFTQFIVNPLSNMFKHNVEEIQSIFNGIGKLIEIIGTSTTWILKKWTQLSSFMEKIVGSIPNAILQMVGAVSAMKGVGFAIQGLRSFFSADTALLSSIDRKMSMLVGTSAIESGGFGGMFSRGVSMSKAGGFKGAIGKGMANTALFGVQHGGKVLGGLGGALIGGTMGMNDQKNNGVEWGKLAGAMGTGALSGAWGGWAGAGIGAGAGAISYLLSDKFSDADQKMNRGGIFTKRYTGKFDVAEGGKPEGFVPLETQDGKPTMPVNLSDDTIRKLAGAVSKIKFSGNVNVKGGANKRMDFYSHVMQPSSPLNV